MTQCRERSAEADCESGSAGAYYPGGVYEYEKHFTAPEQWAQQHIVFEFENTTVVSRLIEGEYFKIDQMLSSDYETKVEINKKELLDCIDRATLLIKEGDKKAHYYQYYRRLHGA